MLWVSKELAYVKPVLRHFLVLLNFLDIGVLGEKKKASSIVREHVESEA